MWCDPLSADATVAAYGRVMLAAGQVLSDLAHLGYNNSANIFLSN